MTAKIATIEKQSSHPRHTIECCLNQSKQGVPMRSPNSACTMVIAVIVLSLGAYCLFAATAARPKAGNIITGKAAFADYTQQKPGAFRKITVADLPQPFETESVDNGPARADRPADAWPQTLPGFKVELYATGLDYPRLVRAAPNGDIFLAESHHGEIKVFRGVSSDGKAQQTEVFATGLNRPFGIAFYPLGADPQWVYVANTDSVVRFPYKKGDLKASGPQQVMVAELPGGGLLRGGGHWTRDIAFSRDGKKMYVSVGSQSNHDDMDDNPRELHRADVLEFNPDGTGFRIYASGIRNAVGIAVQPETGDLWGSVNER